MLDEDSRRNRIWLAADFAEVGGGKLQKLLGALIPGFLAALEAVVNTFDVRLDVVAGNREILIDLKLDYSSFHPDRRLGISKSTHCQKPLPSAILQFYAHLVARRPMMEKS